MVCGEDRSESRWPLTRDRLPDVVPRTPDVGLAGQVLFGSPDRGVLTQLKRDSDYLQDTGKESTLSKKRRRHFASEEKATILRRHLTDKVPVADLCEEYKLQPSVFYQWQRQLLDNAARALEPQRGSSSREKKLADRVEALEDKLRRKDGVIAEISAEFVKVKKELGEL